MEWLEQRTEEKQKQYMQSAGAFGPLAGGVLGIVPQCGFSCVAANLYSGGVITAGVVLAVFMSTSDEMLPIFISHTVNAGTIIRILLAKCALRSLQVMQSILQINISAEDIWQEEKRSIQRLQKAIILKIQMVQMNQSILDIPFRQHRQSMQNVHIIIKILIHIMEKCACA